MAITDKGASYYEPVVNERGYVLMYPQVASPNLLLPRTVPPNPFAESVYQLFPLGTKLVNGSCVWRYCKNSAAALTVIGECLQGPTSIHADTEDDIVVAATSGETYAIGSYDITLTSTANIAAAPWSTKDGGRQGFVYINGGTGQGQCRMIKSHEAASGTAVFKVTTFDPWSVAPVAGNSECGLVENPYSNVIIAAAVTTGLPLGVNPIAVTASYYFWAQTGGPAAVYAHAAIAYGNWVVVGTTAAKADPGAAVTTEYIIGWPLTPGIKDADHFGCFLTIDR